MKHFSCQLHLAEADAGAVCVNPAAMLPLPVPMCTELLSGYTTGPCRSPLLEKKKKEGRGQTQGPCEMFNVLDTVLQYTHQFLSPTASDVSNAAADVCL